MRGKWMAMTALVASLTEPGSVLAHCDSMNGPLIPVAQVALETGDLTPVLKWVGEGDEGELGEVFTQAQAVRALSPEAAAVADRLFLETVVRLHRADEGAPFSGIKDDPVDPVVALGDGALAEGSADAVISALSGRMATTIREKFEMARQARAHQNESVFAGRTYVAAYVDFMHYLEALHDFIVTAGDAHGH